VPQVRQTQGVPRAVF